MAKIDKVSGFNLGQKIANPFKTSRSMSTPNPFKYSNFEGNTLPFADVFEGFDNKNVSFKGASVGNKMRMISSSVMGSMTKLRSSITEPIVNFVNRMTTGLSNAWDYAKNTNFSDLPGIRNINNIMKMDVVDIGKNISNKVSEMGRSISTKMPSFSKPTLSNENVQNECKSTISIPSLHIGENISGISKNLYSSWTNMISKINVPHNNKISADMPVCELKSMWENINAEAASKESMVA